jgi:hypothetical protein
MGTVAVLEAYTGADHSIQVRSTNVAAALEAEIGESEIVRHDYDNVRTAGCGL